MDDSNKTDDTKGMAEAKLDLAALRSEIDALDDGIVDLLNRRAAISIGVGRTKEGSPDTVFKPFREKEVMERLAKQNPGPLPERGGHFMPFPGPQRKAPFLYPMRATTIC